MLKNHQSFTFFVDPFDSELYENLKRTDVKNLSFRLSVHLFVLYVTSSFMRFSVFLLIKIYLRNYYNSLFI